MSEFRSWLESVQSVQYYGNKAALGTKIISLIGQVAPKATSLVEPFGGVARVSLVSDNGIELAWAEKHPDTRAYMAVMRERPSELQRILKALWPLPDDVWRWAVANRNNGNDDVRDTENNGPRTKKMLSKERPDVLAALDDEMAQAVGFFIRSARSREGHVHKISLGDLTGNRKWNARVWADRVEAIGHESAKLSGQRVYDDAYEAMEAEDGPHTVHYIDPPYVKSSRTKSKQSAYGKNELEDPEHVKLLDFVKGLRGAVLISGYDNEIYQHHLRGWHKKVFPANKRDGRADAEKKAEIVWYRGAQ